MIEYFLYFLTAFAVLFVVVCIWMAATYWLNPHVDAPDAEACITGTCGDTMEICLKFSNDRVVKTSHWTDGCAYSLNCVSAAAHLSEGKNPDEIVEIDSRTIQEAIGGLPSDHVHCADLAFETLQAALDHYMRGQSGSKPLKSSQS